MKKIIPFMFVLLIIASCDKDDGPGWQKSQAKIADTGPIALDGCGWMITLENNEGYKPDNLPEEFMIDDLEVVITYKILKETYRCGFTPPSTPPHQMIRIDQIERI